MLLISYIFFCGLFGSLLLYVFILQQQQLDKMARTSNTLRKRVGVGVVREMPVDIIDAIAEVEAITRLEFQLLCQTYLYV